MSVALTEEQQRAWKCASCGVSFAFRHGDPRWSRHCVYCAAKVQEHGRKHAPDVAAQDTPAAWAVIADDWLDNGENLPEAVTAKDAAEFERWANGGPSTPAAMRYARSRIPGRARSA